jgi:hypothetical protein
MLGQSVGCLRTFEAMIELAWQIMLYKALPTVLVRTEPALRDVRLTVYS